ncbi:MAG: prepilin-type N-terminal cleavage/methylation domain-containing protein [Deltaproteobacteria bacterium]|nr:prepilin-type N-terminal cleavage/methylation domain-containing protein [Deltaproteobacteria bacterium]
MSGNLRYLFKLLNKRKNINNNGLTIVELIIALVISLLVVGAASFILLSQSGVFRVSRSVSTEQQRLNTAFNTVKYSLRMAGFDYGQKIFVSDYINQANLGAPPLLPPVQVYPFAGPVAGVPYEVLVMYDTPVNPAGAGACTITSASFPNGSATFKVSGGCSAGDFAPGQIINIINPVFAPKAAASPPKPPITLCVTKVSVAAGTIQANPGNGVGGVGGGAGAVCAANPNAVPPDSVAGGSPSVLKQVLFYWGNNPAVYPAGNPFAPFDNQGALYECTVGPNAANPIASFYVLEPPYSASYTPPTCWNNTVLMLDDYVSSINITPLPAGAAAPPLINTIQWPVYAGGAAKNIYAPTYNETLSIAGESNVALSDSPAYSIHVPYNGNLNGANAKGNAGQVVGNNILKSLSSNVFLRNINYGH